MQVYLPIAEMSVNALVIIAMGGVAGVLSGLFGVGGGFLLTPFLIFIGVPPREFPRLVESNTHTSARPTPGVVSCGSAGLAWPHLVSAAASAREAGRLASCFVSCSTAPALKPQPLARRLDGPPSGSQHRALIQAIVP